MKVELDPSGFSVAGSHVPWSTVLEVFAYKQDLGTYDDLRLGFRISSDGTFWSVSEDWSGYRELVAELPERFPGIRTDWFSQVAFPAFAINLTTLWGEPFPR